MPRKRNRDDTEENTYTERMVQDQSSLIEVKVEPNSSPRTEIEIKKNPDDCEDKVELKKWVKELLARNTDLESDIKKLQGERKDDQQLLEKKRVAALCCRCYSWSLPFKNGSPVGSFYPNPNLVGLVETNPEKFEDPLWRPFNTGPNPQHMYGVKLESYSQMMAAFTNGLTEKQIRGADQIDIILADENDSSHFLFLIHDSRWEATDYIVAGGFGPSNPLFLKAVVEMETYVTAKEKYGDDIFVHGDTDVNLAGHVVIVKDDGTQHFTSRTDPVTVLLRTAQSYRSKVKGFLPGATTRALRDNSAVRATFNLDRMRVESASFSSLPFYFDINFELGSSSSSDDSFHGEDDDDGDEWLR